MPFNSATKGEVFFLNKDEWTDTWSGGHIVTQQLWDRRIKLRCRYECKATDPCLWFSSHRVGHLFAAQQKNRVSGGHAQILTVKFTPFTSRNRRPTLFFNNTASYLIWFVSSCALKCSCWHRFWGLVLAHVAWFAGVHVGFHVGTQIHCQQFKNTHFS